MTDDTRNPLDDFGEFISDDPVVREAALAREETLLQEWPPADDELTSIERGLALWKIGEALFRSRRMEDAADRLGEAERTLARVPELGLGVPRAGALSTGAGALVWLERYREARDVATAALDLAPEIQLTTTVELRKYLRAAWGARALASKALGDWRDAALAADGLLASAGAEPAREPDRLAVRSALLTKAWASRMGGQAEAGLALVEQAISRGRGAEEPEFMCEAFGERAELLHSAGREAEAITAYEDLIATYRDNSEDYARWAVRVARGRRRRWKVLSGFGLRSAFEGRRVGTRRN